MDALEHTVSDLLTFDRVCFGYNGSGTVKDLSFQIKRGEFVAIIGSNGAGKSTVSKLMRGLLRPDSGKVLMDGTDISTVKVSALASKIGFLFQNPDRQLCRSTVREELLFSLEYALPDFSKGEALCKNILQALALNGEDDITCMSRGERQRVALASALVAEPELLVLDEPTTGLDYSECTCIMEYIRTRNRMGVTVVMVCHDMEIVLDYASRVIVMDNGRILDTGRPREIFRKQELLQSASLLPPQIIGLASLLKELSGDPSTPEEMANAILALCPAAPCPRDNDRFF